MVDPNDFEEYEAEHAYQRETAVATGLEASKQEIADLKASVDEVAARMTKLDAAAESPTAVRRATLREVADMLWADNERTASRRIMNVIRQER